MIGREIDALRSEVSETGTTSLELRLAVIDFSSIRRQQIEAEIIKTELAARRLRYLSISKRSA